MIYDNDNEIDHYIDNDIDMHSGKRLYTLAHHKLMLYIFKYVQKNLYNIQNIIQNIQ